MKRELVIYPLLFALFPVLALYSVNAAEVSPSQVMVPIAVVLGATILLLVLSWLFLRDMKKAGLLVSIMLVLCFSFGHIVNLISPPSGAGYNMIPGSSVWEGALLLLWILAAGVSVYFVRKMRWHLDNLPRVLNVVGIVLVIIPTINIAVHEIRGTSQNSETQDGLEVKLSPPEILPDIYYIILDRYASASTLKERLNFDNGEFLDYLSSKGFYVASESRDNYSETGESLASSLNMEYLDDLAQKVGGTATDQAPLYAMLQDYKVWRLLKSTGYEFIHFGSWWEPTRENKYADINVNYGGSLPEFSRLLLKTTAIDQIGRMLALWGDERKIQYERVAYEFDRLSQIPDMEGPTFVFAHFLTPHPDYVFEANGDFLLTQHAAQRSPETQYLDQLVATNHMVESVIDRLLTQSKVPPIIILQADEGPYPDFGGGFNLLGASDLDLRVKTGILNAYFLPGVDTSALYPSITPVNSFRLVFNLYFGTELELLPDRYYASYPGEPYRFVDITDRLKPG